MTRAGRLLACLVALVALGACADDDPTAAGPDDPGSATTAEPAPPDDPVVADFLAEAEEATEVAFTATYSTLRKLGSLEATAEVAQDPPAASITVGDLVVVTGPDAATCLTSAEACVEGVREDRLAASGVFSGFATTGPSRALRTLATRPEADEADTSEREVAGITLRCVSIPVGGVTANTSCLTPEGVYGYVDNAAQRFELTAYSPTAPDEEPAPPFEVGDDASFLAD